MSSYYGDYNPFGPKDRPLWKSMAFHAVAGFAAGGIESGLFHPLDVVKTRLQLQSTAAAAIGLQVQQQHYRGILDCVGKTRSSEGFFSLYKGILPPVLVEAPKKAWKFGCFNVLAESEVVVFSPNQPFLVTFSLAGFLTGVSEAVFVNPFENVKVKMQSNRAHQSEIPNAGKFVLQAAKEDGWTGRNGVLTKGLTATMGRNGVFNMVFFGLLHTTKAKTDKLPDKYQEFGRKAGITAVSGALACFFNIPFDVAKSRIQGPQPIPGQVKYHGTLRTLALVYREEGFRALYKGLFAKVLRLAPGFTLIVFLQDNIMEYLGVQYPD